MHPDDLGKTPTAAHSQILEPVTGIAPRPRLQLGCDILVALLDLDAVAEPCRRDDLGHRGLRSAAQRGQHANQGKRRWCPMTADNRSPDLGTVAVTRPWRDNRRTGA